MSNRVFVDTNVIIDILGKREGYYKDSQDFFTYAIDNNIELIVSTLSFAITHYILSQKMKLNKVRRILSKFKTLVSIGSFDDKILELSLGNDFKDFEDGIQYYIALEYSCEVIISRNKKDFKNSELPVLRPGEYLGIKG